MDAWFACFVKKSPKNFMLRHLLAFHSIFLLKLEASHQKVANDRIKARL